MTTLGFNHAKSGDDTIFYVGDGNEVKPTRTVDKLCEVFGDGDDCGLRLNSELDDVVLFGRSKERWSDPFRGSSPCILHMLHPFPSLPHQLSTTTSDDSLRIYDGDNTSTFPVLHCESTSEHDFVDFDTLPGFGRSILLGWTSNEIENQDYNANAGRVPSLSPKKRKTYLSSDEEIYDSIDSMEYLNFDFAKGVSCVNKTPSFSSFAKGKFSSSGRAGIDLGKRESTSSAIVNHATTTFLYKGGSSWSARSSMDLNNETSASESEVSCSDIDMGEALVPEAVFTDIDLGNEAATPASEAFAEWLRTREQPKQHAWWDVVLTPTQLTKHRSWSALKRRRVQYGRRYVYTNKASIARTRKRVDGKFEPKGCDRKRVDFKFEPATSYDTINKIVKRS